jgi:hypothetical protein
MRHVERTLSELLRVVLLGALRLFRYDNVPDFCFSHVIGDYFLSYYMALLQGEMEISS